MGGGAGGVNKEERARLYLIINILFLIVTICGAHKCSIRRGQKRASYPPRAGVAGCCELPQFGCWVPTYGSSERALRAPNR